MLLGFGGIFRFIMISGILMIYLIFTITLQTRWGIYCYVYFSEDETEALNGYKTPPKFTELIGLGAPSLLVPCLDSWTMAMHHQVIAQMVSSTGTSVAEDSPGILIFCFSFLLCLLCSWPGIFLGTRDGLTCKSKLQMTKTSSGQSLSKSSFLPHCSWLTCVCSYLSASKHLVRFLHLLWLHKFGVPLNVSPEILDLWLFLLPQTLPTLTPPSMI